MVEQLLNSVRGKLEFPGTINAQVLDDSDAVVAWSNDALATVLFPTGDTLDQARSSCGSTVPYRVARSALLLIDHRFLLRSRIALSNWDRQLRLQAAQEYEWLAAVASDSATEPHACAECSERNMYHTGGATRKRQRTLASHQPSMANRASSVGLRVLQTPQERGVSGKLPDNIQCHQQARFGAYRVVSLTIHVLLPSAPCCFHVLPVEMRTIANTCTRHGWLKFALGEGNVTAERSQHRDIYQAWGEVIVCLWQATVVAMRLTTCQSS
jgi:hypothetical protein